MNKELLESQWLQIRDILKEKFSSLTDEDIRQINGRYEQLVAKLQQKYGYSREEAEERVKSWNFDRFINTVKAPIKEDTIKQEYESSSLFKWLLALIPLILIGAYFFSAPRSEPANVTTTTPVVHEQVATQTPGDLVIINGIRNALISNQIRASDLQNVQITAHNGVITLNGTVANSELRDSIGRAASGFTGVTQVVNNLQVK